MTAHRPNRHNDSSCKQHAYPWYRVDYRAIGTWLLILLSGTLMVFAFAPYRYYWIAPLSLLVPIVWAQLKPTHAFRIGYLWALGTYGACFHWIYHSLFYIVKLPGLLALLLTLWLAMYLALYPALAVWLTCRITSNRYCRWLLVFPALWTFNEWLRGFLFTGFSWGELGLTQIAESPLAALAPLLGIHGVTLSLVWATGLLALLFFRPSTTVVWGSIGGMLSLLITTHMIQQVNWTTPIGKPIRVALAQGNIVQSLKWNPAIFKDTLHLYHEQIRNTHADIMILPETALPTLLDYLPSGYWHQLKQVAKSHHMALATGILQRTSDGQAILNTVISSNSKTYYAKRHLVPFVEYLPLKNHLKWLYQMVQTMVPQCQAGEPDPAPLFLATQKIAFNICYEDGFGIELIGTAKKATMLANVSNLAWFGKKSIALGQQLQLSQARALENGRFVLRATNTGMTAIISPQGTITAILPADTRNVLVGMSQGYTGLTPYMRYGNRWVLIICLSWLLTAILLTPRSKKPLPQTKGD